MTATTQDQSVILQNLDHVSTLMDSYWVSKEKSSSISKWRVINVLVSKSGRKAVELRRVSGDERTKILYIKDLHRRHERV